MKRRITTAIVGVAAFVLLGLGIPFAVIAQRSILDSEVVRLQAAAATTLIEVDVPIDLNQLAVLASQPGPPPTFAIYGTDGIRIFGHGPSVGDRAVTDAASGTTSSTTDASIVVATPITGADEVVVGVLRLDESFARVDGQTRIVWLTMAIAATIALGLAWLIASQLGERLSGPIVHLANEASRIGHGGVLERQPPTGIDEIDLLGATLTEGSERINEALARERRFSADVSHQLRTPLAGLRLKLEAAVGEEGIPSASESESPLIDLARIEETVEHLLVFARDAIPPSATSSLDAAVRAAIRRWTERAANQSRSIVMPTTVDVAVRGAQQSVDQILDVLIDNALMHGRGTVAVSVRTIVGGAALDVADEGSTVPETDDDLFRRGHGTNTGIGLALARSIAEAEGGRLLLTQRRPTTFSLILVQADGPARERPQAPAPDSPFP